MHELDKSMYFKAKRDTFEAARILRKRMTTTEKLLWNELKGKQILGLRFRRQHPIDFFIADFYCHEVRLVVEIDGVIHEYQKEYDDGRAAQMEKYDICTIRFNNNEIENNIEKVVDEIKKIINERFNSPPLGGLGGKSARHEIKK